MTGTGSSSCGGNGLPPESRRKMSITTRSAPSARMLDMLKVQRDFAGSTVLASVSRSENTVNVWGGPKGWPSTVI